MFNLFFESLNKVIERIGVDGPALPRKRNAMMMAMGSPIIAQLLRSTIK